MLGSLSRADSFHYFVAECFSVPTLIINDSNAMELTCDSIVQSAAETICRC